MIDSLRRLRALHATERTPIRAEAPKAGGGEGVAVFRLYDPIDSWGGDWGVSAKEFAAALDDLPSDTSEIRLHINSPGGDVFDGIAILNALRNHDARVVAVVDGIAASAASFVAAGADELVMARNSELMIHDAWGLCVGNAEDMRKLAEDLDRVSNNIASVYAEKAGTDVTDWRAAMARETWYTAAEAVDAGLADRIDKKKSADDAKNRFDLSIFNYAGRDEAPEPTAAVTDDEQPEPAPSTEATPPDDAPVTPPEDAVDEDDEELKLVARSLERLALL